MVKEESRKKSLFSMAYERSAKLEKNCTNKGVRNALKVNYQECFVRKIAKNEE